jgi:hypothetical protein
MASRLSVSASEFDSESEMNEGELGDGEDFIVRY